MMKKLAATLLGIAALAILSACNSDVTPTPSSQPTATAPQIVTQPANQTVTLGAIATFTLSASGTAPLSYQWRANGAAISGATGASYTTAATIASDNGASFTCVVTNSAGSITSTAASLTVISPPQITTQPAAQSVTAGLTATFSVTASGAALTYQWNRNSVAISGATAATYTTPATTTADNGAVFSVVVTNAAGSVTSAAAALTVTAAAPGAPLITTQPANQTVPVGQTATFSVVATGTGTLTYQWKKNAAAIAGATAASYTTPAAASTDSGALFTVVVTNSAGSTTSSGATLTVNSAPQITTQPANRTVTVGQTAAFSVVATGTGTLTYQWKKGSTAIAGATSAAYTTPATVIGDNGTTFSVVVTNSVGSVTSNAATLTVTAAPAGTDVVTYKNDVLRSGLNPTEGILTPANVNSTKFGLLRNLTVDSNVDAEALYLSGFSIGGASHNVVFVATENNSVYAFDSDTGTLLWQVSLNGSGETPSDDHGCGQVEPAIGITSTPVIDRAAGTLFLVAMSKDGSGTYHQRLHALNLTNGAERSGSPTAITATYGSTSFAPGQYEERAGLLLSNGTLYTTWASHCDFANYGGWIITLSASTYAVTGALNVAPGSAGSGFANQGPAIWMSDGGPAADSAGNVYFLTGNGRFETSLDVNGFPSGGDYGNSFLKINSSASAPAVTDYFAMSDEVGESGNDTDLGSGGIMLLPDLTDGNGIVRHLAVGAGKDGNMYIVNRDNLGKFNAGSNNSQIWQYLTGVLGSGIWSTPAYFNGRLYYGPQGGRLLAFPITNAMVAGAPGSQSATSFAYPGTSPSVSSNGTANGIVWAYEKNGGTAILHAYDATNLATELYNSNQAASSRDHFGAPNKFITVAVADGKVFTTSTNSVAVFGLLP